MKKLLLACLAAAVVAPAASAATSVCVSATDPAGDVDRTTDGDPTPVGTVGDTPFAPAIDLLSTHAVAGPGGVTATFVLAGDPAPPPGLNYEYWLEFADAATQYQLVADVDGGLTLGAHPFTLAHRPVVDDEPGTEVESWTTVAVTGTVDVPNRTVTITAPPSAFGLTAFGTGQSWTATRFQTRFGQLGGSVGPQDVATIGATLVAGDGTCV